MKKTIKNFFTFFAAFSLSAQVQMVNKPLPLNGKLTERGWQNIQVQSGFKYPSGKGSKTPLAQTSFRIAADKSNLYVSIFCHENKMDKLRKTDGKSLLWTTDCVELFLSPTGHPDEFYQFAVSASNVRFSMFYAEAGGIRPDPYLPFWDSKVFYGTNYWLVQIKIPFSAFYMTRNADWSSNWRLNVARTRMPVAETSSWSSLQGSFLEPHNFRMFSGFPKRNPAHDISIKNVKPTITNFNNGIYFGSLALLIEANAAAAGKYQLIVEEPEGRSSVHKITVNSGLNKIVLPQMEYLRKFPKTNLKLTIKSKKTGFVSGRHYPADFFYEPVRLEVSNPCYKNNFYPGQDHSQISGKLHLRLSATQKKEAHVLLTISGDGLAAHTKKFNANSSVIPFSFNTKSLKEGGKAVVKVTVQDKKNKIASASQIVTRLKKNSGSMLWIKDGILFKNGKPCFFRTMSAWGYQGGQAIEERVQKDNMDFLFPFVVNLEPVRLVKGIESSEATKDIKPSSVLFEAIRKKVEQYRNNPAVDMYYLCDEPEYRSISPVYLKHLYDFISELDPYHPVIICTQKVEQYFDCADILRGHPYIKPIVSGGKRSLHLTIQQVRDRMHDMTKHNRTDKVIGFTGQFFSYKYINFQADYPTWGELESMCWSALAQGVRIFWPYAYHDLGDRPQIYEATRYFNQSIKALEKQLLSNKKHPVKTVDPENMLDTLLIEGDGVTLLIAVNLKDAPLATVISADHLKKFKSMYEFRGENIRQLDKGCLKLNLKPYECVVLTSRKMDRGLKSRNQVLNIISAAEHARAARNNLLFEKGATFEIDSSNPSGELRQRSKLFDGIIDMWGWQSKTWSKDPWYELKFRKNLPKFSRIGIYGSNLGNPTVKIWKFGEWKPLTPKKTEKSKYSVLLNFGETLRTVKIRITFPGKIFKTPVELYEIELLK